MPSVLPLRWDPSPDPITLRVADVVRETKDVVSIHLESATGDRLASFAPGQHLPIAVPIGSGNSPARRTYSLSSSPTGHRYRISVKRIPDGVVSSYLHARFEPGVTLQTYPPAGEFVLPGGDEPVVLIAAGIGVTPMLSMLHAHVENDSERRLHFYYGARDGSHLAMASEIRSLVAKCASAKLWVALSQPEEHEALGDTYDMVGRLEGASIAADVGARADYLLCGPSAFMASMTSQLSAAGVPVERIFYESFGAG
ncbi:MAG: FAD-binding oxidoreductase [Pseudomonadota bacterium]